MIRGRCVLIFLCPLPLIVGSCTGDGKAGQGAKGANKIPVPVETTVVQLRDVPLRLRAVGNVAASEIVAVRPEVTAQLKKIHFSEGEMRDAGSLLFELDDRPFATALAAAEAELERSTTTETQSQALLERERVLCTFAELESKRIEDLESQKLVSTQQADQTRATLRSARASVAAAEAACASAKALVRVAKAGVSKAHIDLSWCRITAPISGRTGAMGITPGNLAISGQTVLVTLVKTQPMYIEFAVPAENLPRIRAAWAKGALEVRVQLTAEGISEQGSVGLIENQIDTSTGTIRLRAHCANTTERLWPGQQCQVDLLLGLDVQQVTVPQRAVQAGQQGSLVWVVASDTTVSPRLITIDRVVEETVVVNSGLRAGETVVVDGQIRLTRGATVAVLHEKRGNTQQSNSEMPSSDTSQPGKTHSERLK